MPSKKLLRNKPYGGIGDIGRFDQEILALRASLTAELIWLDMAGYGWIWLHLWPDWRIKGTYLYGWIWLKIWLPRSISRRWSSTPKYSTSSQNSMSLRALGAP